MLKFLNDELGEITETGHYIENGQVFLKIQYRSKAKGFLICVSDIFAPELSRENEELLLKLTECVKKNGSSCVYEYEKSEYRFFYVDEEKIRVRESELQLPSSVKSPARIDVYWIDHEANAHIENEEVREVIVPISIKVELKRYKKGLIKKEYFCDVSILCQTASNVEEGVLFYCLGGKNIVYPIPKHIMTSRQNIVIKTQDESTSIVFDLFPEYKKLYKLQVYNN